MTEPSTAPLPWPGGQIWACGRIGDSVSASRRPSGVDRAEIAGAACCRQDGARPAAAPPHRRPALQQAARHCDGQTFTVRDADPRRWGLLTVWEADASYSQFAESSPVPRAWARIAAETWTVRLRPLASRGTWSGQVPFGDPPPRRHSGPVAALTRARIRPAKAATFWRAVPPVSADLRTVAGLRWAVGIGEAPIGLQGTFSLWDSAAELREFAYNRAAHQEAIARTSTVGWYAEELFARFAVERVEGTWDGSPPLGPAERAVADEP